MHSLKSLGIALVLVLITAIWFLSGTIVRGGLGPVEGEKSIVSTIEADGGPLTSLVESAGLGTNAHHDEEAGDPTLTIAQRNALATQSDGQARSVRVQTFNVQAMPLAVTLRGHTSAKMSADVVAETSGLVEIMSVADGQSVTKGDLICTLDAGTREASVAQANAALSQAEAAFDQAESVFEANKSLRERGLATVNSAETHRAALRAAEAGIESARVALGNAKAELAKTEIRASMDGIVERTMVEVGNFMNIGASCAKIINLDPMVFVGTIPQARINFAKLGMLAEIKTINGEVAEGKVSFTSISANAATRTFDVEIEFPNPRGNILDGLTAEAKVQMGNIPAHLLPQSVLTLSSEGVLGVRAVRDGLVVFYPLSVVSDAREGIWVTGLPASVEVIVLGQEYVTENQTVTAGHVGEANEL